MPVESRSFFGPLTRVTKKIWPFGMAPLVTYRSFLAIPGIRTSCCEFLVGISAIALR
jgi:hypothetical protein